MQYGQQFNVSELKFLGLCIRDGGGVIENEPVAVLQVKRGQFQIEQCFADEKSLLERMEQAKARGHDENFKECSRALSKLHEAIAQNKDLGEPVNAAFRYDPRFHNLRGYTYDVDFIGLCIRKGEVGNKDEPVAIITDSKTGTLAFADAKTLQEKLESTIKSAQEHGPHSGIDFKNAGVYRDALSTLREAVDQKKDLGKPIENPESVRRYLDNERQTLIPRPRPAQPK
jgi:hypothetical protein